MTYPEDPAISHARFFQRAPDREKMLLRQAEEMLAERKAKARPVTATNQHFDPEPPKPPTPQQEQTDELTRLLQARLARSDKTGGSSGRDVGE